MIEKVRNLIGRYVRVKPARRRQSYRTGIYVEWFGPLPGHFFVDVGNREVEFKMFLWETE